LRHAHRWINDCVEFHEGCISSRSKTSLPSRLIDVGPPDGSGNPYLFIPAEHEGPPASQKYVALSYCRGKSPTFTTTVSNLAEMKKEISWDRTPQTIKDAISITRKLGIRYLCVDALCILQVSIVSKHPFPFMD
jgi:hypothetical protein